MANYQGVVRTNYFKVKDEKRFKEICNGLVGEDNIIVEVTKSNGNQYGFIGSYSPIDYFIEPSSDDEFGDYDMTRFYKQMQEVIAEDDAMILIEVGHEKLRYLVGSSVIITADDINWIDIEGRAINTAQNMLGNPDWNTRMSY